MRYLCYKIMFTFINHYKIMITNIYIYIKEPRVLIFNRALTMVIFSDNCKIAKVKPLYKNICLITIDHCRTINMVLVPKHSTEHTPLTYYTG